jgi:carbon-monoxide dehydrogenase large subunit
VAATLLEAAPEDVVLHDGQARVVGAGGEGLPLERVAAAAYFDPVLRRDHPEPHLSEQRFYDPGATYSNGCIVCAVEVDPGTGGVRILDLVAVEDCGRMINPMIVDGQIRGAAAQGVGAALLERVVYDDAGQALTGTLADYLLPTAADVPRVRIRHMESPSPVTVGGIKGMGESGMIAVPAAVANAIMDAVPRRPAIDHIPLDPGSIAALFTGEETA